LVPHHIVFEANPDWRLLYWIQGGLLAVITAAMLSVWGGVVWLRHFAPAFLMLFFAVPWPTIIEQPLVQGLMRMVASATVELLNLSGIIAVREGNLISLSNGVRVGVEEACSGVRSLQSSIMAAYFLGELFRFLWRWRIFLLLAGIPMAVLLNLCRTLFLTLKAYEGGTALMGEWHDIAGNATSISGFVLILIMATLIKRFGGSSDAPKQGDPLGQGILCPFKSAPIIALYASVALGPIFTAFWFYIQEPKVESIYGLKISFPGYTLPRLIRDPAFR